MLRHHPKIHRARLHQIMALPTQLPETSLPLECRLRAEILP